MTILFSVITPTYNRADELSSLFKSLNNQEGIEFEWVIIDDGSEDHTQQQVNDFKKHNKNITDIKYFYQENKGKNSAVIRGIQNASGDYIVVIDSDDYLLDDALIRVKNILDEESVNGDDKIIGISGVKVKSDFTPVSYISNSSALRMSHYEWFYKFQRLGDRIDFYKARVLKEKIFNAFPKEKFITEDAYWLDLVGEKIFINEPLLVIKYLEGGLSSSYSLLLRNSPFGTSYYYYILLINADNFKTKLKASLLMMYYIFVTILKNSNVVIGLLSLMLFPILCIIKFFRS